MTRKHWSYDDVLKPRARSYEPESEQRLAPTPVSTRVARSEARRLVAELALEVPIDVEAVCAFTGAAVLPIGAHEANEESVGLYVGGGVLKVRTDVHPWVRRVTLAHELGHHVLRHDIRNRWESVIELSSRQSDPHEIEAWAFAGQLLVPDDQVKRLLTAGCTASSLARALQVTSPFLFVELGKRRLLNRLLVEC